VTVEIPFHAVTYKSMPSAQENQSDADLFSSVKVLSVEYIPQNQIIT
jgi:hypothetical protein